MVMVNLLPWREHQQAYQKKIVKKFIVLSAALPSILIVLLHSWLALQQTEMQTRIATLNALLNRYASHYGKHPTVMTQSPAENTAMLLGQKSIFRLFTELGLLRNNVICFSEINGNQNSIYFTGKTRSATDLTDFVSHWSAAALFSEIRIKKMTQQDNGSLQFIFQGIPV